MIIIRAKLFSNPTMHGKVMGGHQQISLKSMNKVKERTVALTFDLATWFLFATYCLGMIIICAKLVSNPIMQNKVMGWTRTGFTKVYAHSLRADCNLDV